MDKISVIVPVYNGTAKLRRCVESILNQTYLSIELILVDDGSNDGSERICDEYKEKYQNVKVIHKCNGGVSSARNAGLQCATGQYIGFVDSDDFIESNMYQTLIDGIEDSDLIMCGFYQDKKSQAGVPCKCIISKEDAIRNIIGNGKFRGYLWNKLFKKSIIDRNRITFITQIHMCEDLLFCTQYIDKIKKVCLIPEVLYHYEDNGESSASNGKFTAKKMSIINAYNNLLLVDVVMKNSEIYNTVKWKKIRHCISLWGGLWKSNFVDKKRFAMVIKQEIKDAKWDFLLARENSVKHKMLFALLKIL